MKIPARTSRSSPLERMTTAVGPAIGNLSSRRSRTRAPTSHARITRAAPSGDALDPEVVRDELTTRLSRSRCGHDMRVGVLLFVGMGPHGDHRSVQRKCPGARTMTRARPRAASASGPGHGESPGVRVVSVPVQRVRGPSFSCCAAPGKPGTGHGGFRHEVDCPAAAAGDGAAATARRSRRCAGGRVPSARPRRGRSAPWNKPSARELAEGALSDSALAKSSAPTSPPRRRHQFEGAGPTSFPWASRCAPAAPGRARPRSRTPRRCCGSAPGTSRRCRRSPSSARTRRSRSCCAGSRRAARR